MIDGAFGVLRREGRGEEGKREEKSGKGKEIDRGKMEKNNTPIPLFIFRRKAFSSKHKRKRKEKKMSSAGQAKPPSYAFCSGDQTLGHA